MRRHHTVPSAAFRLILCGLLLATAAAQAQQYENGTTAFYTLSSTDGPFPSGLVSGPDANIYGTASGSTNTSPGTAFRLTPQGAFTKIATLDSMPSALKLGNDGNFYGSTRVGGTHDLGTLFKVTPGGVVTTLYSFTGGADGRNPGGLTSGPDGYFFGFSAPGTLFTLSPSGQFTIVRSNVDANFEPNGMHLASDGYFYGTVRSYAPTYPGGVVFRMDRFGVVTILASFPLSPPPSSDPVYPNGGVTEGPGGFLYGCTSGYWNGLGGPSNSAVIYRLHKDGSNFGTVARFDDRAIGATFFSCNGLLTGLDERLYGVAHDTFYPFGFDFIFRFKPPVGPLGNAISDGDFGIIADNLTDLRGVLTMLSGGSLYTIVSNSILRVHRPTDLVAKGVVSVEPVAGKVIINPQATLTDAMLHSPVLGRRVDFSANGKFLCSGYTGGDGTAKCQATVLQHVDEVLSLGVRASFADDGIYARSTAKGTLVCVGTVCVP